MGVDKPPRRASPEAALERLPDAELDVLACLWQSGRLTAREIRERLLARRPMAHGSVMTLLGRLSKKGLVSREKAPVGKAFVFRAVRRPDRAFRGVVERVLERVFGGDRMTLVATLFSTRPPTPAEHKQLRELLAGLQAKPQSERSK